METGAGSNPPLVVYGARWCHDTQRSLTELDRLAVPYEYIDVDEDPEAKERVTNLNRGRTKTPTILSGDDETNALVEPSNDALDQFLRNHGYLA